MRRNWIKIYIDQCLRGTMMDEMKDPAERFVWFGFLLLAGDSAYEGKITLTEDMGYSDEQLGAMLKCDAILIKKAKKVMIKYDKIKVLKNNVIQIVNWEKYQSEYQRQKPYRSSDGQKLLRKVTTKGDGIEGEGDIDKKEIRIEVDNNKVKKITFSFDERKFLNITIEDKSGWLDAYPAVDVDQELRGMREWLLSNPTKRKSNYRKFITNWLSREQDKGGTRKEYKTSQVGESTHIPSKKENDYTKTRAIKMKEVEKKYQPEIDKARKAHASDWLDEIDNKMKEEIAEFSREYHKKEE